MSPSVLLGWAGQHWQNGKYLKAQNAYLAVWRHARSSEQEQIAARNGICRCLDKRGRYHIAENVVQWTPRPTPKPISGFFIAGLGLAVVGGAVIGVTASRAVLGLFASSNK